MTTDIAVIAMAFRFPGASEPETFWNNLRDGIESITTFSPAELLAAGTPPALLARPGFVPAGGILGAVEDFDAAFFDFTPREAEIMDPQHRLLLECAWEAVERAGYDPDRHPGAIGLYAGANSATYLLQLLASRTLPEAAGRMQLEIGNEKDHLASQISYRLNLHGPSLTVQTGCSTSLVAVHLAVQSLLGYECDLALAGGVSLTLPQVQGYLHQEGHVLSPDGHCRAFDHRARGTVNGSGAAVVVLKRLEEALADGDRVHAVIKGTAVNNDGARKVGYSAPSVAGQAQVIAQALAMARLAARDISYVEAHGTGTTLGDPIEMAALKQAFAAAGAGAAGAAGSCAVGSVKTNLGHLNTAAGLAGLIKTVLMLRHRQLAPSLHFERLNPAIDLADTPFYVNAELRPWHAAGPRRAGVSSFSIGGTNAHVILEEAPEASPAAGAEDGAPQLVVLSAKTPSALAAAAARLAAHLGNTPDLDLADVAFTLQTGRKALPYRRALAGHTAAEIAAALLAGASPGPAAAYAGGHRPVAFLFPGQGTQYPGMGEGLYRSQPTFRREVDRCAEILAPRLGRDLRRLLFPAADELAEATRELAETALAQPALFVHEHALARLWMAWGVQPEVMLGHSVGELVAACLAGVFSLEDALALVAERGRLMQALPPGAMLAVALGEEELVAHLGGALDLAAVNGPAACVVAGPAEAVADLEEQLTRAGTAVRRLPVRRAFHSRQLEPVRAAFAAHVAAVRRHPPRLAWISNLTGEPIADRDAVDPDYWGRQLRHAVRFSAGLAALLAEPSRVLLEVGPGDTLTRLAGRHPGYSAGHGAGRVSAAALPSREPGDEERSLLAALGRLWTAGVTVDWPALHAGRGRRRVELPTYPFERRRFWIDGGTAPAPAAPTLQETCWLPTWKQAPLLPPVPAAGSAHAAEDWLVFSGGGGLGERIVAQLRSAGEKVCRVEPGDAFSRRGDDFTLRPAGRADCSSLLAALAAEGRRPTRILHLWNVGDGGEGLAGDPGEAADGGLDLGLHSLIALAQALGEHRDLRDHRGHPLHLAVVSSGLQALAGEPALHPARATLLGPCRVIPREVPGVTCQSVDVVLPEPGSGLEERLAASLIAEARHGADEPTVAYRDLGRWVRRYEPFPLAAGDAPPSCLRPAGVYLVVGGLDGIGFEVACELGRQVGARLVLAGRGDAPEAERMAGLAATGAEALVVPGFDLAAPAAVAELARLARERFGTVHGVVIAEAAAGAGGLMQFRERAATRAALAPARDGVPRLLAALAALGDGLDLLVLFSSTFAETGALGLVERCAADAFLDAYARREQRRRPGVVLSLGWSLWRSAADADAGPAVALQAHLDRERSEHGLTYEEGGELFVRTLSAGVPHLLISRQDLSRASAAPDGAGWDLAAPEGGGHARPDLATAYLPPANPIEAEVADSLQQLLGIERVGRHDDFFALGGHSLLAVQLINRLRGHFQIDLPLSTVFEAPTVSAIAVRIAEAHLDALGDAGEIEAMLREIQALSPEELRQAIAEESRAGHGEESPG